METTLSHLPGSLPWCEFLPCALKSVRLLWEHSKHQHHGLTTPELSQAICFTNHLALGILTQQRKIDEGILCKKGEINPFWTLCREKERFCGMYYINCLQRQFVNPGPPSSSWLGCGANTHQVLTSVVWQLYQPPQCVPVTSGMPLSHPTPWSAPVWALIYRSREVTSAALCGDDLQSCTNCSMHEPWEGASRISGQTQLKGI